MAKPKNNESKLSKAIRRHIIKPENYDDSKSLYRAMRKYGFEDKPNFYNNSGRLVNAKGIYNQNNFAELLKDIGLDLAFSGVADLAHDLFKEAKLAKNLKDKDFVKSVEKLNSNSKRFNELLKKPNLTDDELKEYTKLYIENNKIINDLKSKKIDYNNINKYNKTKDSLAKEQNKLIQSDVPIKDIIKSKAGKTVEVGDEEIDSGLTKLIKLKENRLNKTKKLDEINYRIENADKVIKNNYFGMTHKKFDERYDEIKSLTKKRDKLIKQIDKLDDSIKAEKTLNKHNKYLADYVLDTQQKEILNDPWNRLDEIKKQIASRTSPDGYNITDKDVKALNELKDSIVNGKIDPFKLHTNETADYNNIINEIDNLKGYYTSKGGTIPEDVFNSYYYTDNPVTVDGLLSQYSDEMAKQAEKHGKTLEDVESLLNAQTNQQIRDANLERIGKDALQAGADITTGAAARNITTNRLNYTPKVDFGTKLGAFAAGFIPLIGNALSNEIIDKATAEAYMDNAITNYFINKVASKYDHPRINDMKMFASIPDSEFTPEELEIRNNIWKEVEDEYNKFDNNNKKDYYKFVKEYSKDPETYIKNFNKKYQYEKDDEVAKKLGDDYDLYKGIYESSNNYLKKLAEKKGYYNPDNNTYNWNR